MTRRRREAVRTLGTPVRLLLIGMIRLYQVTLSGWLGGQCRFSPTCSRYAEQAIRTHGVVRGVALAAWRIARCGPFTKGGLDHVPPARSRAKEYDVVITGRSR